MVFVAGKGVAFFLLLILFVLGYYYMKAAERGKRYPIRRIRAFEAIEEAVGRAVEMGRPIHFTFGFGNLYSSVAPQYVAGIAVLSYVARLAGKYGARLIATFGVPEAIPIVEEIVREGYRSAGRPELFKPEDNVRYLTNMQFAYASAVQATLIRERPGANIMVGPFYAESLIFAETGSWTGALQIAGTARETQIPFFVLACDYVFIGEEIFAAAALASGDPAIIATIRSQDIGKLIALALIVIGLVLLPLGVNLGKLLFI